MILYVCDKAKYTVSELLNMHNYLIVYFGKNIQFYYFKYWNDIPQLYFPSCETTFIMLTFPRPLL